jgi:hypothetical protein
LSFVVSGLSDDGVNHALSAKSAAAARGGPDRDNAATFLELVRQSPE